MKQFLLLLFFAALVFTFATLKPSLEYLVNKSIESTVEVRINDGAGSGMVVQRGSRFFVWTCGHVVESHRKVDHLIEVNGIKYESAKFDDVKIRKIIRDEVGEEIDSFEYLAKVIKYSRRDFCDLALVEVKLDPNKEVKIKGDTKFLLRKDFPKIGDFTYHVGGFQEWSGFEPNDAVSYGSVGQLNRLSIGGRYDLIFGAVARGCSGGGVYLQETGECIGMVTRANSAVNCLIRPTFVMRSWAEMNGVLWAIDPKEKMPTEDELKNMNIEDELKAYVPPPIQIFPFSIIK